MYLCESIKFLHIYFIYIYIYKFILYSKYVSFYINVIYMINT